MFIQQTPNQPASQPAGSAGVWNGAHVENSTDCFWGFFFGTLAPPLELEAQATKKNTTLEVNFYERNRTNMGATHNACQQARAFV